MSLTITKEGEPQFPQRGWGLVGIQPPRGEQNPAHEELLAILPEDQGTVASAVAKRLEARDRDVIDSMNLPGGFLDRCTYVSPRFLHLAGVEVNDSVATATYTEQIPASNHV
jgi:hypothetical protein